MAKFQVGDVVEFVEDYMDMKIGDKVEVVDMDKGLFYFKDKRGENTSAYYHRVKKVELKNEDIILEIKKQLDELIFKTDNLEKKIDNTFSNYRKSLGELGEQLLDFEVRISELEEVNSKKIHLQKENKQDKENKEKVKPNNQKRKELIEKAKKYLNSKVNYVGEQGFYHGFKVDFIVNKEKRKVICLIKNKSGKVILKGIAVCTENDVFNEYIGKTIALIKADYNKGFYPNICHELADAVQPDKVVKGMRVSHKGDKSEYLIKGVYENNRYDMLNEKNENYYEAFKMTDTIEKFYNIIDDTNAEY